MRQRHQTAHTTGPLDGIPGARNKTASASSTLMQIMASIFLALVRRKLSNSGRDKLLAGLRLPAKSRVGIMAISTSKTTTGRMNPTLLSSTARRMRPISYRSLRIMDWITELLMRTPCRSHECNLRAATIRRYLSSARMALSALVHTLRALADACTGLPRGEAERPASPSFDFLLSALPLFSTCRACRRPCRPCRHRRRAWGEWARGCRRRWLRW